MASIEPVQGIQNALAAKTLQEPETFETARAFLKQYTDLEILRHWTTSPLPGAPAILDNTIGVAPDLEWHSQNKDDIIPELEGKITQVGYAIFPMATLLDCKAPADFAPLLKKVAIHYIHVIENCHLRMTGKKFVNTEKHPLFCSTRLVSEADVKDHLVQVLDKQILTNGSKAPVVLIGHGWQNDEIRMKEEWKLRIPKLDSIVAKVDSLGRMAAQAGLVLMSNRLLGISFPNLDTILQNFGVNLDGYYRHNGANDSVYQLTLALVIVFFPMLYPDSVGQFPGDPSIAGQSINQIWSELMANKDSATALTIGHAQYCFYCETADDHDGDNCPAKSTVACQLCSNAIGKKNARFRQNRHHQTSRCVFHYKHHVRKFHPWLADLDLSLITKRKLRRVWL
jgi:hypothetical protein